ncbi:hypothetical protein TNCT_360391 [Trichonephila clavata]|uniref:Uncharacterized protein n=1 Tax=Trichonephila clavata TaxID=2740835 RepID=A0A8X6F4C9_TRICU|nr:hypothetical protein TNCT_360391 [Trichonephila clavata]
MLVFTAFQTCGMIQNIVISSMKDQYENYNGNGYIRVTDTSFDKKITQSNPEVVYLAGEKVFPEESRGDPIGWKGEAEGLTSLSWAVLYGFGGKSPCDFWRELKMRRNDAIGSWKWVR